MQQQDFTIKIVIQNLQKRPHLASQIFETLQPDVLLAQEINFFNEDVTITSNAARFTSRLGYGTAIITSSSSSTDEQQQQQQRQKLTNIRRVSSPHAETIPLIRKKTIIATYRNVVELISFHGYNGQPYKNVDKLLRHVDAVLAKVSPTGPAVFGGDFNTWTEDHLRAVERAMKKSSFRLVSSWVYPGRKNMSLDHLFVRDLATSDFVTFGNDSDHEGAVFRVTTLQK